MQQQRAPRPLQISYASIKTQMQDFVHKSAQMNRCSDAMATREASRRRLMPSNHAYQGARNAAVVEFEILEAFPVTGAGSECIVGCSLSLNYSSPSANPVQVANEEKTGEPADTNVPRLKHSGCT